MMRNLSEATHLTRLVCAAYLVLSDPGWGHGDWSCLVSLVSVLVVLVLRCLAVVVVVAGVPGELDVLIHPEVMFDVFLHVDVTEARSDMGPVCLVMVVAGVSWVVVRLARLARMFSGLQWRHLARLLLGQSSLQHRAGAGAAGRGWTVRSLQAGGGSTSWEELPVLKVVRRHEGFVCGHGGRWGSGVLGAGVARS